MSTTTVQLPHDGETTMLFRQPLAPLLPAAARRSTGDLKLMYSSSSSYTSLSATRSYSDNDDERHSLCQRRKYSIPLSPSITRPLHGRRRSRNSPVIPASHTPNRSYHGSQRRTSLPAIHFHETKVATLHLDTPMPKHGDAIPEDIYRQLRTYTFGSPDPQRAAQLSVEDPYLNDDEDEKLRDSRAKRRNTSGLSKDSLLPSTPSVRPQSSLSSFSSAGIVVGEVQMDDHSEPDWNTVMNDVASRPSSSLDNISIRSEPRRPSLAALPVLRRQSRSADELKSTIDQADIARTPTQTSFHSASQRPIFDRSNSNTSNTREIPDPNFQAYNGFNLPFIFDRQVQKPSSSTKPSNHVGHDALDGFEPLSLETASMISLTGVVQSSPLKGQTSAGNIFSRLKAKVKPSTSPHEDTFMQHIMDAPEWTFRRISQTEYSPKVKENEIGHKRTEGSEGWWCEPVGKFTVCKTWTPSRSVPVPPPNVKLPYYNRLQICRHVDPPARFNAFPVIVHRHSQVQGFSIYRCHTMHPRQPTLDPIDSILLATKSVLRQYTRTRSTRSLKTYDLLDDVKPSVVGQSHTANHYDKPKANYASVVIGGLERPSAFSANPSTLLGHSDQGELLSSEPSRPTTASSVGTDRSLSLITDSSKTLDYPQVISSSEHILSESSELSPRSPRFSTSHAEAFAMITDSIPTVPSTHPHSISVSHAQKSPFGWLKAFSSKPSLHKDPKEPSSPATDEEEELKKESDFAGVGPWLKIAPRAERVEAERQVKQVSYSFECVGLIPPHEKRKVHKHRSNNNPAVEECEALRRIASDSMCMLLPLWPEEMVTPISSHASLSGRSFRSGHPPLNKPTMRLEDRKYLLVSYISREGVSNKRRRSQNGNSPVQSNYTEAFHATGQILSYEDLRSSGFRLPEKGLCVNSTKAIPLPQEQKTHVIAVCPNKQAGVMIVHESLEAFGFVESSPEGARLNEMGKAVAEMIWCGCITLMTFMS